MTPLAIPSADVLRADGSVDLLGTSALLTTIELGDSIDFYLASVSRGGRTR